MTIAEIQAGMASGAVSALSLTRAYLQRIDEIDRPGPALNSVIELNPDALAVAEALDAERLARGLRGPIHGVPVLIKDNIDTADRMMTTAGSLALAGSRPERDACLVRRLREAGAVILGKTNLSEWANFRSTRSSSGWSSRGGQTRNPYALDRNPSGSSSGSAAAAAAHLCAVAVGTETDGSILSPASRCGVVGLKPTVGLVSRTGIIPISHSQDTAGPMTRTVADAAALLGVIAGIDPADPATAASSGRAEADYTRFLAPDGLHGSRIGVARNFFAFGPAVDGIVETALATMRTLGAELVDPIELPAPARLREAEAEVLLYEFKDGLNRYLDSLGPSAPIHSLAALIDFNDRNAATALPYFGQERLVQAQGKGPLSSEDYRAALEVCRRLSREEGIDAVLRENRLDAIVAPSGGPATLTDLVNGDPRGGGGSATSIAAVAGYPSITVPAGHIFGLPVGISFIGAAYAEATLLKFAFAFEQATNARRRPAFLATVELGSLD